MNVRTLVVAAAASAALLVPALASAQKTVTKMGDKVTVTATIQQIDKTARLITFRNEDGTEDTVYATQELKRFDELKVGDKVSFTYYDSAIFSVRKPGDPPINTKNSAAMTAGKTALPSGTMAAQIVKTVTVKSVDPSVPSLTVTTDDGRTITRKVDKKQYIDGVKPGDKIDIVYTQAVLASVERPK